MSTLFDRWNTFIQYSELEPQNDEDLPLPVRVARGSAFALWPLSKSAKNKLAIQNAGGLSLLARYFKRSQSYFYKWNNWNGFTTCGIHFIMYNNCKSVIIFQTCSHEANLCDNSSNRNIAGTFLNFHYISYWDIMKNENIIIKKRSYQQNLPYSIAVMILLKWFPKPFFLLEHQLLWKQYWFSVCGSQRCFICWLG